MWYVYVIVSLKYKFTYVGLTDDVAERIRKHNEGQVKSTRFYAPLRLVYFEAYLDRSDAAEREQNLKHHGGAIERLKKRIERSLKFAKQQT